MSASSAKITRAAAAADEPPTNLARMRRAPTHPGTILIEDVFAGVRGKQAEAAKAMGWSLNRMNEFVLGKRPITIEGALDLAEYTGTSPEFWLTLQLRHDLWHAMQARKKA